MSGPLSAFEINRILMRVLGLEDLCSVISEMDVEIRPGKYPVARITLLTKKADGSFALTADGKSILRTETYRTITSADVKA